MKLFFKSCLNQWKTNKFLKRSTFYMYSYSSVCISPIFYTKDHYMFLETVYSMYCGLVITVIHFISTILLLYGALTVIIFYVAICKNNFMIK